MTLQFLCSIILIKKYFDYTVNQCSHIFDNIGVDIRPMLMEFLVTEAVHMKQFDLENRLKYAYTHNLFSI